MNICIKAGSGLRAGDTGLIDLGKESQIWVSRPVPDESFSSLIGVCGQLTVNALLTT